MVTTEEDRSRSTTPPIFLERTHCKSQDRPSDVGCTCWRAFELSDSRSLKRLISYARHHPVRVWKSYLISVRGTTEAQKFTHDIQLVNMVLGNSNPSSWDSLAFHQLSQSDERWTPTTPISGDNSVRICENVRRLVEDIDRMYYL